MSEGRVKIGSRVIFSTYRRGLTEATVTRLANHPRYDAQSVEVEYDTIFGKRIVWLDIDSIRGVLPEDGV